MGANGTTNGRQQVRKYSQYADRSGNSGQPGFVDHVVLAISVGLLKFLQVGDAIEAPNPVHGFDGAFFDPAANLTTDCL